MQYEVDDTHRDAVLFGFVESEVEPLRVALRVGVVVHQQLIHARLA